MNTLDACAVLHKKELVESLLTGISDIARQTGKPLRILLLISESGSVDVSFVKAACLRLNVAPWDCRPFDDRYLDFSGYGVGLDTFLAAHSQGVLFINDTFASKHNCAHLRSEMARQIRCADSQVFTFPLMIGPYRHSEFAILAGEFDQFISSFIFYLNTSGMRTLESCISELNAVETRLLLEEATSTANLEPALLRFCRIHALQLQGRYAGADAEKLLARKLATAYAERMLSYRIKLHGVAWFVAGGIVGRVLVPLQQMARRLSRRLAGKPGL